MQEKCRASVSHTIGLPANMGNIISKHLQSYSMGRPIYATVAQTCN